MSVYYSKPIHQGRLEFLQKELNCTKEVAERILLRFDILLNDVEEIIDRNREDLGKYRDNEICCIGNNVMHELVGWLG